MISSNNDKKLTVDAGSTCIIESEMEIIFPGGKKETLKVQTSADFSTIDSKHHQIFLDSFTHQFNKKICIYNTHTYHNGSKVPTVKPPLAKKKSWLRKLFS